MSIQVIVASLIFIAAVALALRWQRKVARSKRYGERRHRHRQTPRRNNWARTLLLDNPASRMFEKRRYRSPNRTDQTL